MGKLKTLKFVKLLFRNEDGQVSSIAEFCEVASFSGGLLHLYGCHMPHTDQTYERNFAINDILSFELHNVRADVDTLDFAL